jgi:four helix bundle protein
MKKTQHPTPNLQPRTPKEGTESAWVIHHGAAGGRNYGPDERLLKFAPVVIDLSEKLSSSRAGNEVAGQVLRSGTSPCPNPGEAEAAGSSNDFIPKHKVCLKELRKTRRGARLIHRKHRAKDDPTLLFVLSEAGESVRVFFSNIRMARKNPPEEKRRPPERTCYPSSGTG